VDLNRVSGVPSGKGICFRMLLELAFFSFQKIESTLVSTQLDIGQLW
jgi:hypothetical protein